MNILRGKRKHTGLLLAVICCHCQLSDVSTWLLGWGGDTDGCGAWPVDISEIQHEHHRTLYHILTFST